MKIDCPHCGVQGSVDDSLAGRKLRCPKCSKVFLVTEDVLPEGIESGMVHQEILYDDPPQETESIAQNQESEEVVAVDETDTADTPEEALLDDEDVDTSTEDDDFASLMADDDDDSIEEDSANDEEPELGSCSVCGQSFASAFLVEIESKVYCALCQPEPDEEGLELQEEDESSEDLEDEFPDIMEEDSDADDDSDDEEELLGLMDDEDDPESEDDSDNEPMELEVCSGCGESLHPDFLETVGSKRYCALCAPEEGEEDDLDLDGAEESEAAEDEESLEIEDDGAIEALMADDNDDEDDEDEVAEDAGDDDDDESDEDEEGYPKEPCSVCGERFHRDFMQEIDSKLYCGVCQPEVIEVLTDDEMEVAAGVGAGAVVVAAVAGDDDTEVSEVELETGTDFTVGDLIKAAWKKTKGAKASVWGAMIVMYALLFALSFGGMLGFQGFYKGTDAGIMMGANGALQLVISWLSMIMTGGVMLIGVRRALEQRVSWKMVFAGFSKAFSITIALILQTILVVIGFVLLVLPGIYLSVGYALVLPLIIDKGMGPWEALEASRKAIHKKWWTVFGAYLVMMLLYVVSAVPLGLGLIWTIPMFFVLIGVLYVRLFGADETLEEDLEDETDEEVDEEVEEEVAEEVEEIEDVEEDLEEISEEVETKQ